MITLSLVSIITAYQRSISPDHSIMRIFYPTGFCRYYPTCSDYAKHAFLQHTPMRATGKTLLRLMRCNPWSKGGIDFT